MALVSDTHAHEEEQPERIQVSYEFRMPAGKKSERLDVYLAYAIRNATRTKVQKAIAQNMVWVNGKHAKASRKLQPGDHIVCHILKMPPIELCPEDIPLNILYEDDDILVINKPVGLVVHPGVGHRSGTLVNALLYHMGVRESQIIETDDDLEETLVYQSDAVRPGIVHRLDKDTSGIMVVSKNPDCHALLAKQFEQRISQREYQAVVWGNPPEESGLIDAPLGRSTRDRKLHAVVKRGGKSALTEFCVLERFPFLTLLSLKLQTGRTHQIRVHCSHIGHPLFGDEAYGGTKIAAGPRTTKHRQHCANLLKLMPRQALHAKRLAFRHPRNGEWLEFDSDLPQDFQDLLAVVRKTAASG